MRFSENCTSTPLIYDLWMPLYPNHSAPIRSTFPSSLPHCSNHTYSAWTTLTQHHAELSCTLSMTQCVYSYPVLMHKIIEELNLTSEWWCGCRDDLQKWLLTQEATLFRNRFTNQEAKSQVGITPLSPPYSLLAPPVRGGVFTGHRSPSMGGKQRV